MSTAEKCLKAIETIRPNSFCVIYGMVDSEADFNNNVKWETGIDEDNNAILTDINPHSEITWTKVKEEMDKL
tara:strand:+ start:485 stop:700 length:216 start_codon:yes stop_codon:yes gene_type:complete